MSRVVVVGASQQARQTIDLMVQQGVDAVVGLVDDAGTSRGEVAGVPVLGTVDELPHLVESHRLESAIVAIGDNWTRMRVAERVVELCPMLNFATAIHPSAQIGGRSKIGAGTTVMAGVVISNDSIVGDHALFGTNSSVDHDAEMGAFASLAPNVATGGTVRIGIGTAIGIGASVIHGITIGEHTVVGAGSTVLHDLPDHVVAYGTPARVVRGRVAGDRYL